MNAQDLEERAIEFLAAEYDDSDPDYAEFLRSYSQPPFADDERAIRAIVAALRQQPAPVDLEQFREAVECWKHHRSGYDDPEAISEADHLLSIIDNAGEVECPHDAWEETGGARRCADCHKYLGGAPHQPAPVVDDAQELPPLPDATLITTLGRLAYTATQMQKYARAALARAQGGAVVKFKPGDKEE